MLAAFRADLAQRLNAMESLAAGLQDGSLDFEDASAAVAAHLHDIKGTGRPFGVPQATDLAREFERIIKSADWHRASAIGLVRHWVARLKGLC